MKLKRLAALAAFGLLLCIPAGLVEAAADNGLPTLPEPDVVIDAGHGGVDGGTSHGIVLEKSINLAVASRLYTELHKKGIPTVVTRSRDYALSDDNKWLRSTRHRRDLAQRVEIANRLRPHYFVSLHVNWSASRAKSGPLVIYQKSNEKSKLLALELQAALNKVYGSSTNPEPGRKYFLLKNTRSPAVIVEMGYMSNGRDRALLTSPAFQQKLAEAMGTAMEKLLRHPS